MRRINYRKWIKFRDLGNPSPDDHIEGPLRDLRPSDDGKLSVWRIDDNKENLGRVVAALAITRGHVQDFEYALIDECYLTEVGIVVEFSEGNSPDVEANKRWHRDLVGLSSPERIRTLTYLFREKGDIAVFLRKQVAGFIDHSLSSECIQNVGDSLREKIKSLLLPK